MVYIASRANHIEPSASSVATQRARALRAEGRDIVSLAQGEPDFATPDNVIEAAIRAMRNGETGYTPAAGTMALREAICLKFKRDNGLDYGREEVIAGAGGKQIIYSALMATLEPGDEVILAAPYWISYRDMTQFAEGVPVTVACREKNGFKLTPQELLKAITPRTRWLILNSPNNPSGAVYSTTELKALGEVLLAHQRVMLLSDDIYEHIRFDGLTFATMAAVEPRLRERTLTINGVSKAYSMTGWRLGFAAGPADLVATMAILQNQSTGNPCSITQAASIEALTGPQHSLAEHARIFQTRRNLVLERLNETPGLTCRKPDGAFYVYPNCAGLLGQRTPGGKTIATEADVVTYLMEDAGVAVVQGAAYGLSPHFRVSVAASTGELEEACRRIQAACQALG